MSDTPPPSPWAAAEPTPPREPGAPPPLQPNGRDWILSVGLGVLAGGGGVLLLVALAVMLT